MAKMRADIEVAGIVMLATFTDGRGRLLTPEYDEVEAFFEERGYDVEEVEGVCGGPCLDGAYRVGVKV